MRRRKILIATLAIAVVVATIGGVSYALRTRAPTPADAKWYPGLHAPLYVLCPGPTDPIASQGRSDIHPRNDCTPSFTQQDVRDYVAHMRSFVGPDIRVVGQLTVTRVVFFTIGDLSSVTVSSEYTSWRASMVVNFPADMLVCYAGLRGTFIFSDGIDRPSHESDAFIVFDAHTGNGFGYGIGAPLG